MRRDCPIIEIDMLVIGGGNGGQPCSHGLASVQVKLPDHPVKTGQARLGLPGNENMIIGSALTPLRESVTALPASR